MELTLNDLFCGCGGVGLGFKQAGFTIVGSWDWDKYAVKSYAANVEDHVKQSDISQMTWTDLPKASVWTFGFPCQDLSIAGQQRGMKVYCEECGHEFNLRDAVADAGGPTCPECKSYLLHALTRSGLFFEVMRLLQETRQTAPDQLPGIIMAENVKGLGPYLNTLRREYERVGYIMQHVLFNSKYWGVPQSRERYYVVGVRADLVDQANFVFPTQQTTFVPRLYTILEPVVAEKYYMSEEKASAVIEQIVTRLGVTSPDEFQSVYMDKDGCAYCCDANYFKGTSPNDVGNGRRTQVIEIKPDSVAEAFISVVAESLAELHASLQEVAASAEPEIEIVGRLNIKGKDQWKRVFDPHGVSPTLTAVQGGMQEAKIFDYRRFRVRKLTPREYARLQGFPEDYKFVCSDSQIYKQMGNAVTVNVAKAIANQIRIALEGI